MRRRWPDLPYEKEIQILLHRQYIKEDREIKKEEIEARNCALKVIGADPEPIPPTDVKSDDEELLDYVNKMREELKRPSDNTLADPEFQAKLRNWRIRVAGMEVNELLLTEAKDFIREQTMLESLEREKAEWRKAMGKKIQKPSRKEIRKSNRKIAPELREFWRLSEKPLEAFDSRDTTETLDASVEIYDVLELIRSINPLNMWRDVRELVKEVGQKPWLTKPIRFEHLLQAWNFGWSGEKRSDLPDIERLTGYLEVAYSGNPDAARIVILEICRVLLLQQRVARAIITEEEFDQYFLTGELPIKVLNAHSPASEEMQFYSALAGIWHNKLFKPNHDGRSLLPTSATEKVPPDCINPTATTFLKIKTKLELVVKTIKEQLSQAEIQLAVERAIPAKSDVPTFSTGSILSSPDCLSPASAQGSLEKPVLEEGPTTSARDICQNICQMLDQIKTVSDNTRDIRPHSDETPMAQYSPKTLGRPASDSGIPHLHADTLTNRSHSSNSHQPSSIDGESQCSKLNNSNTPSFKQHPTTPQSIPSPKVLMPRISPYATLDDFHALQRQYLQDNVHRHDSDAVFNSFGRLNPQHVDDQVDEPPSFDCRGWLVRPCPGSNGGSLPSTPLSIASSSSRRSMRDVYNRFERKMREDVAPAVKHVVVHKAMPAIHHAVVDKAIPAASKFTTETAIPNAIAGTRYIGRSLKHNLMNRTVPAVSRTWRNRAVPAWQHLKNSMGLNARKDAQYSGSSSTCEWELHHQTVLPQLRRGELSSRSVCACPLKDYSYTPVSLRPELAYTVPVAPSSTPRHRTPPRSLTSRATPRASLVMESLGRSPRYYPRASTLAPRSDERESYKRPDARRTPGLSTDRHSTCSKPWWPNPQRPVTPRRDFGRNARSQPRSPKSTGFQFEEAAPSYRSYRDDCDLNMDYSMQWRRPTPRPSDITSKLRKMNERLAEMEVKLDSLERTFIEDEQSDAGEDDMGSNLSSMSALTNSPSTADVLRRFVSKLSARETVTPIPMSHI